MNTFVVYVSKQSFPIVIKMFIS